LQPQLARQRCLKSCGAAGFEKLPQPVAQRGAARAASRRSTGQFSALEVTAGFPPLRRPGVSVIQASSSAGPVNSSWTSARASIDWTRRQLSARMVP
jgi:hypothetical protein